MKEVGETPDSATLDRRLRRAAKLSLGIGLAMLVAKLAAWRMTGSTAILSDALEGIVNVVAAAFALYSVRLAQQPPDQDHPYGHGKAEPLAALAVAVMLVGAAIGIAWQAAGREGDAALIKLCVNASTIGNKAH